MVQKVKKKFSIKYKWCKNPDAEEEDYIKSQWRLVTNDGAACFPFVVVTQYAEKEMKENQMAEFWTNVYDMENDRAHEPSASRYFDNVEDAKEYGEYKLLGGKIPNCVKIQDVEDKLDRI